MYTAPGEIQVSRKDRGIDTIIRKTFPNYSGRRIKISPQRYPLDTTSYWSGGSRSYYAAIDLKTLNVLNVPQNGTPFDGVPIAPNGVTIPLNFAIVEHRYSGANPQTIIIHVNPGELPKLIKEAA